MPKRIQRKRTKGWKMPPNTVYVGRPSRWGNIYKVGAYDFDWHGEGVIPETIEQCVELYEKELFSNIQHDKGLINQVLELRGKDLACWCALDKPCHADVLLKLANEKG
jgi:hypothetical protein